MIKKFGPPDVLSLVADHPKPSRKPGEVLVAVHATSVNPIDCKFRNNEVPRLLCWYLKASARLVGPLPLRAGLAVLPCRELTSENSTLIHALR